MIGMGGANYHTQFETASSRACLGNIKAHLKRHIRTDNHPIPSLALFITASGVRYKISSGNVGNVFAIHNTTGALYVAKALDYEKIKKDRPKRYLLCRMWCEYVRLYMLSYII